MNQRLSNNNDKNKNNLNFISLSTGGQTARHSPNETPQIQSADVQPLKATGDVKPESGMAKASPNFKPMNPPEKAISKEEEKKTIAKNSTPVEENKTEATE